MMSTPLFLKDLVLRQPQCKIHPMLRDFVATGFDVIDRVGEAFIIAGFIGIVVEQGGKTRFIKEVAAESAPLLIGRHLPVPFRIALLKPFNANFMRPSWEIEYEIEPVNTVSEYVRVTSRVTGLVRNCDAIARDFDFWAEVDASPRVAGLGDCMIELISMTPELGGAGLGFNEKPKNHEIRQTDGRLKIHRSQLIQPNERWQTVLETLEYRPIYCVLPLFVATMVASAKVRIRCKPKVGFLQFAVSTGDGPDIKPTETTWGWEWIVDTPIVPGGAIVTLWNPIRAQLADATDPKTEEPVPGSQNSSTPQRE
jgi:hypothetical protein